MRARLDGALVQPTIVPFKLHAVDIDASAVARLDVMRVGGWPPTS
jgi:hypothetical protein